MSEVDVNGVVLHTFTDVSWPKYLSVDSKGDILVADWRNHHILLLNSLLLRERVLINTDSQVQLWYPRRLYLNELTLELYVLHSSSSDILSDVNIISKFILWWLTNSYLLNRGTVTLCNTSHSSVSHLLLHLEHRNAVMIQFSTTDFYCLLLYRSNKDSFHLICIFSTIYRPLPIVPFVDICIPWYFKRRTEIKVVIVEQLETESHSWVVLTVLMMTC